MYKNKLEEQLIDADKSVKEIEEQIKSLKRTMDLVQTSLKTLIDKKENLRNELTKINQ